MADIKELYPNLSEWQMKEQTISITPEIMEDTDGMQAVSSFVAVLQRILGKDRVKLNASTYYGLEIILYRKHEELQQAQDSAEIDAAKRVVKDEQAEEDREFGATPDPGDDYDTGRTAEYEEGL
jgi:hypothetical protein